MSMLVSMFCCSQHQSLKLVYIWKNFQTIPETRYTQNKKATAIKTLDYLEMEMLQHLSPESWGPALQLVQSEQTGIAHRSSSLLPVVAEEKGNV